MRTCLSWLAVWVFVMTAKGQDRPREFSFAGDPGGIEVRKGGDEVAASTTEGVFTGIELGDYAHWKMRSGKEGEISFFILRPDATVEKVLESPESYLGRKCRVVWKKTTEDFPEAGGKMEVEHVVRVEWLDKK